ncbi:MAG: DUF3237 domain-containing protein [bacterium]
MIAAPELDYLFSYTADLEQPQQLVAAPAGLRMIAKVMGGRVSGPRLTGEVLPGGGDWAVIDEQSTLRLDARLTIRSEDGALIYVSYRGVMTPVDPDTVARAIEGKLKPGELYFRTTPIFETGDERYGWLNTQVAVAVGNLGAAGVSYDVFGVR